MMVEAMVPLLYEPDCSVLAGNPARRQIDFDPNDLHQCDSPGRMEELRVYKLSGGMMLRVFH